ncbi:hypothetical protein ACPTJC_09495, partial [Pseudomonas aeruginosa]
NSTTGYHLRWPKKNSTHCPGWVDHYTIDFTELQELSELLGKLKSCVDVAIDNAPEAAKS